MFLHDQFSPCLEPLEHLANRSLQLIGNRALLLGAQTGVHLAQVAVDDILDGRVLGPEGERWLERLHIL